MAKKQNNKSKTIFHGTSEEIAKMSLVFGLNIYDVSETDCGKRRVLPGSTSNGIVLTDCYSGFMAHETASIKDRWAIVEIDLSQLDNSFFYPHEYFLLEKSKKKIFDLSDYLENTKNFRSKVKTNQKFWQNSLNDLGIFIYGNNIPSKAISKVVVFDWKTNWMITREAINVQISSKQHPLQKDRQKLINKWLSCDFIEPKEWCENYDSFSGKERETISSYIFNKSGLDIYHIKQ